MGILDGKAVAVTGAGRGIGRAVALDLAAHGASVVVNDYGVAVDGTAPTSDVASAVVREIEAAGGKAVASASSVTTMQGGASIVQSALDASVASTRSYASPASSGSACCSTWARTSGTP